MPSDFWSSSVFHHLRVYAGSDGIDSSLTRGQDILIASCRTRIVDGGPEVKEIGIRLKTALVSYHIMARSPTFHSSKAIAHGTSTPLTLTQVLRDSRLHDLVAGKRYSGTCRTFD